MYHEGFRFSMQNSAILTLATIWNEVDNCKLNFFFLKSVLKMNLPFIFHLVIISLEQLKTQR